MVGKIWVVQSLDRDGNVYERMIAKALPAQVHMLRDKTLNFCEASFHGILQAHQLCSLHRPSLNRKLAVLQSLPSCSDLVVEMTWYEMLWNVQHVRHQRQGGLNILNDFFFFPVSRGPVGKSFSFCDVARHWINHHGSCPDDWYAGDTLCRRCLWAARNCNGRFFLGTPQKKGSSLHPQDCQNLPKFRLFDGFLQVSQQKTKTCPLHPYGSLLQEISNFSDGTRNQGISESTLQLQWAWWRPCWSELWDFPGTKIFRRSFRKDDGPNTPITRPLMMVKEPIRMITVLQGEFHANTETYRNHQFSRRKGGNLFA